MFLLRRIRRKPVLFACIGSVLTTALLLVLPGKHQSTTHRLDEDSSRTDPRGPDDDNSEKKDAVAASYWKMNSSNTPSSVFENQLRRQRHLAEACARLGLGRDAPNFKTTDMYVNDSLRYIYCVVNKVACTTWKRVLLMASGNMKVDRAEKLSQTYVHNWHVTDEYILRIRKLSLEQVQERLKTHFKFMFVRHPLERLVSTYRDKFTKPAYYYKRRFGTRIVRAQRGANATQKALTRAEDVKFQEMVRYLLDPPPGTHRDGLLLSDNHWRRQVDLCHPCYVRFDFIGHYETLYEDAQFVLDKLGVADRVQFPNVDPDNRWKKKTAEVAAKILAEITPDELRRVRELYAVDFELFGYQ